jgi:hypothetical protein
MSWYRVEADCPVEFYEAEDEISAIEKYSQNYRINYRYCSAELDEALNNKEENSNNN